MKLYKIRHKETKLYKVKHGRNPNMWHKNGDTYSSPGMARSAMKSSMACSPRLVDKLEIVEFEVTEVGIVE